MDDTFERQVQPLANQLRGLFPSLTIEQATDCILRHGLNLQASIDELLANPPIPALPPKNSNPFAPTNVPIPSPQPSQPPNLLDLDDLFGFSSPKVTSTTTQNSTVNDLSDIFGGITTSPPPETPTKQKEEHKKKHVTKAESETEKDSKKTKKKSREDKHKSDVKKASEKTKKDTSYSDTEAVEIKNKDKKKEKEKSKEDKKEKEDKQRSKEDKQKEKDKKRQRG